MATVDNEKVRDNVFELGEIPWFVCWRQYNLKFLNDIGDYELILGTYVTVILSFLFSNERYERVR